MSRPPPGRAVARDHPRSRRGALPPRALPLRALPLRRSPLLLPVLLGPPLLAACEPGGEGSAGEAEVRTVEGSGTRGGEGRVPAAADTLAIPPDLLDPPWLERRRRDQLASRDSFSVFVDFGFVDRLPESGIRFRHRAVPDAGRHYKAVHYDHGNAVAAADVDGDGRLDLLFTDQAGGNELWRSLGGGRFEDVTARAGIALPERVSVAAAFGDIDNDGDADLFITTVRGGNALFENDGTGRFRDIARAAGVDHSGHSSGAVFLDFDRDGLLDLFVANVGRYTSDSTASVAGGAGGEDAGDEGGEVRYHVGLEDAFSGHLYPERAERSILYRNEGGNRFADVTAETGLRSDAWTGEAVAFDANGDGWPDLYVLDMQGNDEYWENRGGERFVERGREVFPRTPWGSMGVEVLDFDRDGRLDLYLTDMHSDMWEVDEFIDAAREREKPRRTPPDSVLAVEPGTALFGDALYRNEGGGRFVEVADRVGAETYWPWGPSAGDLNADGWPDLFVVTSMNFPFRYQPNTVLLNDRGRFRRAEFLLRIEPRREGRVATPWFVLECGAADRALPECRGRRGRTAVLGALGTRSAVLLDLEGDGDLDVVTNDFNSEPMVLVSDLSERKPELRWLAVRLVGTASNRDGLGAVVRLHLAESGPAGRSAESGAAAAGDGRGAPRDAIRVPTRLNDGKSGYLAQSRMPVYFGLGPAERVERIEVEWPSGRRQTVRTPRTNRVVEVREPR